MILDADIEPRSAEYDSTRPMRRSLAITSAPAQPAQHLTRVRPPSPSRTRRERPPCSGQRQRQLWPSRLPLSAAAMVAALMMAAAFAAWFYCRNRRRLSLNRTAAFPFRQSGYLPASQERGLD